MKYLYRIVNIILAALFFPAVFFLDLIFFRASTSLAKYGLEESISLKRIIDIFTGNDPLSSLVKSDKGFTWPEGLAPLNARLLAAAVALGVAALAAIFIIIFSVCSGKRIPVLAAAGVGLAATIVMIACFNSAAGDVVDGTVNIVSAIGGSSLITALIGGVVSIDKLMLGGFHNGLLIIFILLIVWTASYMLIELGDKSADGKKSKSR